ncbi:MAG: hypothetical protein V1857_04385 [archaeon]
MSDNFITRIQSLAKISNNDELKHRLHLRNTQLDPPINLAENVALDLASCILPAGLDMRMERDERMGGNGN